MVLVQQAYISNYTGHAKIDRLLFIADRTAGKPLELEALRMAHDELKKTENTHRYQEVVTKINGRLGSCYNMDRSWVDATERRSAAKGERLESELQSFKAALMKESIRMGHSDLGDWAYDRGDLQTAFKCYVRTRDYCTTSRHVVAMCLAVIRTALELGNFVHVANYIGKAESTPDVSSDPVTTAKLRAASGLHLLHNKKFKQAARKFCEVSPELGSSYSDVIALHDLAVYGSLCALASLDRSELRTRVISNIGFREVLELAPEIRELVHAFYNSQYASALRCLEALKPTLLLDMHVAEYVPQLYALIRHRALCQYVQPFSSVNLATMAVAFNTPVGDLEKQLAGLIMDGAISARIDSATKVLYASKADLRATTFSRVLSAGEAYCRDTRALLLRANLVQHDFMQVGGEDGPLQGPVGRVVVMREIEGGNGKRKEDPGPWYGPNADLAGTWDFHLRKEDGCVRAGVG
ncbi:hypothetical protein VOLCADRAFT_63341 [Volvox carteri f. nagariensis]|uniref:PCI domain-containing protein n=1 Tax=Volvox carteri f. nagariensis TaxID=3068 RepID=D8U3A7_VOLCA|nr:uncharacterized protein VOLCADRAFT_63341 [Volvox carteri f. nagariensis]EFJ45720.1 hypothetical protein VOLCADRAFT_63341 [Volvox carteri f. nagariensis]|eukprot:XP_002953121.1 hypothetical protein VOLCADRAFT_63341 [Volvox carteri f. nagariensis]